MGFIEAVKSCFSNYANFKGRAVRSEFWYFFLFIIIVAILAVFIDISNGYDIDEVGPASILSSIFCWIPSVSVSARRLHDTDRSGWLQLLYIIPVIGWVLLTVWFCIKGTRQSNRFGEAKNGSNDNLLNPTNIINQNDYFSDRGILTPQERKDEEDMMDYIMSERESGNRRQGAWARALIDSEGDEAKAESLYIKYAVQSLVDERTIEDIEEQEELEKIETRRRGNYSFLIIIMIIGLFLFWANS